MGQTESHYTQPPSQIWLKVQYISSDGPRKGMHIEQDVGSALNLAWFIQAIATQHKRLMKNDNVSILIGDLYDYHPTGFVQSLRQPQLRNILDGVFIEGLRIEGQRFSLGTTEAEKVKWWNDVQDTFTFLGLRLRPDVGISIEPLKMSNYSNPGWAPVDTSRFLL
jgi:hypothetical protein